MTDTIKIYKMGIVNSRAVLCRIDVLSKKSRVVFLATFRRPQADSSILYLVLESALVECKCHPKTVICICTERTKTI